MSIRLRITVIISLLFAGSLAIGVAINVISAKNKVRANVDSALNLAAQLFVVALGENGTRLREGGLADITDQLLKIDAARHIDIDVLSEDREYPRINQTDVMEGVDAPDWFASLIYPRDETLVRTFGTPGNDMVLIRGNPADEINESWREVTTSFTIMLIGLAVINTVLFILLGYWLRPIGSFISVLESIEREDYSHRIPRIKVPELQRLGEKINHLTSVLGYSKAENERLNRKSLMIQERERRHLAHELHDTMGQSISAIKAMAVSIKQRCGDGDPITADSAENIEEISDKVYASVRDMIGKLRPAVLDELGLSVALKQMVGAWNQYHDDIECHLELEGEFDNLEEEQQINIYRIIQEALTNIARHSSASEVEVALSGREVITLSIADNGVGYDPGQVEKGMGLTGIRERAQALHGELRINARPRQGVGILLEFPRVNKSRRRRATDVWSR